VKNIKSSQSPADAGNREAAMANPSPDSMFTRDKGAVALSDLGFPVTKATLATLASRGGGPPYRRFGKRALYRWADLVAWAEARCSASRSNTSQIDASLMPKNTARSEERSRTVSLPAVTPRTDP
jgi:hypothetical protein